MDGRFTAIIRDYNKKPAFSDFLPGIAGLYGVPAWCFFVNRGQGVASFGTSDKDHAIMEFAPAHTSYQLAETRGFRSFAKLGDEVFELFSADSQHMDMGLGLNNLTISCLTRGLEAEVCYYVLPDAPVGALARGLKVTNRLDRAVDLQVLDGMPALVPYGVSDWVLKNMVQTGRAWMETQRLESGVPRYRVRVSMEDSARVTSVSGCAFAFSVDGEGERLPAVADPETVFGCDTALRRPLGFLDKSPAELAGSVQAVQNTFPCFFTGISEQLGPGESARIFTLIGHAESDGALDSFLSSGFSAAWFDEKLARAEELSRELTDRAYTKTASPAFDAYCRQSYLDNCLRGGWPVKLGAQVLHPFTRKHGDLERDYNYFYLAPEPFSQGNGNFRDVNQNRRCDVSFSPFVEKDNVEAFCSLMQLDGYNPLQINPETLIVGGREYSPGELWKTLSGSDRVERFAELVSGAEKRVNAVFGEGYWSDHWTYTLDLIEDFLRIWPERRRELLCGTYVGWLGCAAKVLPRARRCVETENGLRQYRFLEERETEVWERGADGLPLRSTVLEKLTALCALKFAALDPYAVGVEMEGGKPGWYDALNGLPGLFGSSVAESCELVRLLRFVSESLELAGGELSMPECQARLIGRLWRTVSENRDDLGLPGPQYGFWRSASAALETYREECYSGTAMTPARLDARELSEAFSGWAGLLARRLELSRRPDGLMPTYFRYEAVDWRRTGAGIEPLSFRQNDLPLFLEGPVHDLKLQSGLASRLGLHEKVKSSALYDAKLGMYRVNEALDRSQLELGRAAAFTPGWLENGSIWLHMEYKYLLELLKGGLYEEFFEEFRRCGVPFLNEAVYGRSTTENVSFIVSSLNPDERLHGRGFVARLSGSTAEFLQMWQLMFFGPQPFALRDGKLELDLRPAIPEHLIDETLTLEATLAGTCRVRLHFAEKRDYFPGSYTVTRLTCSRTPDEIRRGAQSQAELWME